MKPSENAEKLEVKTRRALRSWLLKNHDQSEGVWLTSFKKHTDHYLPYDDIVEECLCFGWVDSLPRKLDDDRSMHYLSPRKKGSNWSKVNKERIKKLIAASLMTEHGLAKVEAAKNDGSWSFLDDVESGALPDDLVEALAAYPDARKNFDAFPRSSRRLILEWVKNAKKPETRARRILDTAKKAQENIRANHYRQ